MENIKNGVSNPAVTKEVATGEVPLAVDVTVISLSASLATPLCHQRFGAGRAQPGSIQLAGAGGAGRLLSLPHLLLSPALHRMAGPLSPALPAAPSVLGRWCSPKAAI